MPKQFLFAPLLVAMVALAACGSGSDDPEPQYLDEVESAAGLIGERFEHFGELINRVYPTRGALFGALAEAGAGTAFDGALAAMEMLEPPARFRGEHELALDDLREFQRVDREVGQAVLDNDLVAFGLANVELGRLTAESPLQHSSAFCLARFSGSRHLCERPDFSSSAGYGEELYTLLSRIEIDARPGVGGQVPAMNDAERLEVVLAVVPRGAAALEEIAESLEALSPPESLQADHDVIVRYVGDLTELTTEWRDAAESGDLAASQAQQELLTELICSVLITDLSPAIAPIAIVHFGAVGRCEQDLPF